MRSISKSVHCIECARKCANQAKSMHYAIILAPTVHDAEVCKRKYRRAVKHANRFIELANYYGGK